MLLFAVLAPVVASAQAPDTVFIRQDKNHDDTLIYESDTIVFTSGMMKNILIGSTVIPYTYNQIQASNYGLKLEKVTRSNCRQDGQEIYSRSSKINSILSTDTTLTVDIKIVDNCCFDFLYDFSVIDGSTINLSYVGYGTYCGCNCCYGVTFHFSKNSNFNKKEMKTVMINNNPKSAEKIR
ncbi:MAG: hypothetical protein LPJ89_11360 [Hymenobacteraceae bacterium]|nr:hypothetical protein [Hymenobacteraceae bacterium]MDX5395644.1 hypothetical protein [Hymenobacteraceae bacterium]MDX5444365.1 hypothetical protein [Hymenobacteraceae bacterium]MDX5511698.1 hypothetical protein [Hymenobacteraceae bacterium]